MSAIFDIVIEVGLLLFLAPVVLVIGFALTLQALEFLGFKIKNTSLYETKEVSKEEMSAYLARRVRELDNKVEQERIKDLGYKGSDIKYMGLLKN